MAVQTFARLEKPKQFRPSESVKFILQYSSDLCPCFATLEIQGGEYELGYFPYKQTVYANANIDGVYYIEFDVPAYALGEEPYEVGFDAMTVNPGLKALVHMGIANGGSKTEEALKILSEAIKLSSKYNGSSESWLMDWQNVVQAMNQHYSLQITSSSSPSHEEVRSAINIFREAYLADDGHVSSPVFTSNTLAVPIYLAPEFPLEWGTYIDNNPIEETVSSSVWNTNIHYRCYTPIGSQSDHYINSYRYFLYNSKKRLVYDSGTQTDWSLTNNTLHPIRFTNLKDGQTYYCKVKASLTGGYTVYSQTKTLHVQYESTPAVSGNVYLKNIPTRGSVEICTHITDPFDRLTISRTIKNMGEYLTIGEYNTTQNITIEDSLCLPNTVYTYRVSAYKGKTLVGTYYHEIRHEFDGICIADMYGAYCTEIGVEKGGVQKNTRTAFQTTIGRKYTCAIITGRSNYFESGSTAGVFVDTNEECVVSYEEIQDGNIEYSYQMLDWLNNGNAKLLKYDDGFAAIVAIEGSPSIAPSETSNLYKTSFGWKEIADCSNIDSYTKCGLVGDAL